MKSFLRLPAICLGLSLSLISANASNPALKGLYADPDIIYSQQDQKFYIYPTSDGFTNWSGTYFKTFSSTDFVNWTDEGVILSLPEDVSWADGNAWAPTIIEKKTDKGYKYYYYFCAEKKVGVAISDHPTGPFVDSGKPIVGSKPAGIRGGQEIDPAVFCDPVSQKNYLFWGNGYLAVVELNEDMISYKPESLKIITPDRTFREGVTVFYREGKYYFLWSENDTRSEDYRVRYGTSNSPLGPIEVPENNMVIVKDPEKGIYGTGHNAVIEIPGTHEWYIVYHRFTYPEGINMGREAGYNREVCIDPLTFDAEGRIVTVSPTHEGVQQKIKVKKSAMKRFVPFK